MPVLLPDYDTTAIERIQAFNICLDGRMLPSAGLTQETSKRNLSPLQNETPRHSAPIPPRPDAPELSARIATVAMGTPHTLD